MDNGPDRKALNASEGSSVTYFVERLFAYSSKALAGNATTSITRIVVNLVMGWVPGGAFTRIAIRRRELRWFWSITVYVDPALGVTTNGRVPTLEKAKARFRASWS